MVAPSIISLNEIGTNILPKIIQKLLLSYNVHQQFERSDSAVPSEREGIYHRPDLFSTPLKSCRLLTLWANDGDYPLSEISPMAHELVRKCGHRSESNSSSLLSRVSLSAYKSFLLYFLTLVVSTKRKVNLPPSLSLLSYNVHQQFERSDSAVPSEREGIYHRLDLLSVV